ncbi:F0F1 ATP synthase subunit epsilon [Nocardia cyriacigeorgica]|jgi:F-type H+-transporting ATPase subunit epsilon|uniref:F0F1 ATP synthase subunit epsilon n=1 Tax=Nocardia cyriacigeorgica TaxID=135487 RepID=UPI000CEA466A|nr:F0F1 ATP synthase subunit epsilon [Nocardia cyriacigeorgica]AVH20464.1 F0F1 ATP synthase subunit epsilon [Nocardia cyriacigeorgica]MBF6090298.1 F0F1 ATP synthase subunit epsilon [Nocardia cyriacigeorgica]MBF6096138.1 F0F1 ATP synthase subunit epsilon [Nocardia cyriacigeorgica]MBF6101437.1 F0F1 ATP synthase subunit epsilon [Nocardia cyriacigeorgica]MBF6326194.1 F0F1 ATP synthase subunit epsilon [Nocardia cyriacigeorgica]
MADMSVDLVAVERLLWSGRASFVSAQTTEGQIGIMAGHEPLLGQLVEGGTVTIVDTDGQRIVAAVHGGFFSVTGDSVRVLAESAEFAGEVDVEAARRVLAEGTASEEDKRVAQGRVRAVEQNAHA